MTDEVDGLIEQMTDNLQTLLREQSITDPLLVGIHTGGTWVAQRLHQRLQLSRPLGELNISFYRDDFSRIGPNPEVKPSQIPFEVEDRHIILVDDVLYTGRTVRAALNELFDYGRPASVILAVLVEREGRELPIHAAVSGLTIDLQGRQHIKLCGPIPMNLKLVDVDSPDTQEHHV